MIDTEALRKKVIDLAIQGKLTQQLSGDGNAEDLYIQIQKEKAKLVKEGKIKKEKPLPEISADEIPFEIPKNWKWVRWGNIVNVVSARRVHQSDWKEEGIPFYRAREIATLADTGIVNNELYISEELYEEFSKSGVPHAGDLMVTGVGTLGKTYVVKESERFYYKDASVLCFENYAGMIATFLKRVMETSLMRSQIDSNSGGTTVDTLTMVRMNQYLMPLPPLDEQKRIVKIIDEIYAQIDLMSDFQQQYEADRVILKSKIIDAGIRGKLTEQLPEDGNAEDLYVKIQKEKAKLIKECKIKKEKSLPEISDDEIPFETPRSWKWVRLGECVELLSGQDFVPENYNAIRDGLPYMTGASNIVNDELVVNRWTPYPKNISKYGDLLIVCKGSGFGKTVINHIGDVHIARQFMAIKDISKTIDLSYVRLVLDGNFELIKSNGQGLIPGIDRPTIRNMLLPLPPLNEQIRIVDEVNEMLCLIE